jgi:hypothetical protein
VSQSDESDPTPPAKGRRKVPLIAAAVVVVLVVAGVVIYLVTGNDDPADTADPGVPTIEGSAGPTTTVPPSTPAGSTPPPLSTSSSPAPTESPAGDDAGAVQSVAEEAAKAISDTDMQTLAELSCDPSTAGTEDTFPDNTRIEVVGEPQIEGDVATIDIRVTVPEAEPAVVPMPMTRQNDRWCIL